MSSERARLNEDKMLSSAAGLMSKGREGDEENFAFRTAFKS